MIHPKTTLKFISPEVGFGVVATEFIPKGTITWVQDKLDQVFDYRDLIVNEEPYKQILDTYCFRNRKGNLVLCWDNSRFVNHSFNSNCLTTAYDFELAIRDIEPGEQLTDDYGYLNIDSPFRGIDEGTERKVVFPDDLLNYHEVWDKKLLGAFKELNEHEQPLRYLLTDSLWRKAEKISKGETEMDSILNCYFAG